MKAIHQTVTDSFALYNGDAVELCQGLPSNSIHFGIHSPPFSNLYIYSDSVRDMGNCSDDSEFLAHYGFLVEDLYRVTVPGRLHAVYCKQLVNYTGRDGRAGLRDFRGDIIRLFDSRGWQYHSEVCIWKDPVIEMQRTKAQGLLHKQLCQDSSYSRQGMAEYLVIFRKWAKEGEEIMPVTAGDSQVRFSRYVGECGPVEQSARDYSIGVWQRYASPVWMDIRQTRVLNVEVVKDDKDERHICPLQLDVTERAIELWTNPGETVLDPFAGIGSTGYVAAGMGRRSVGFELKAAYYQRALKNITEAVQAARQPRLFDGLEGAA